MAADRALTAADPSISAVFGRPIVEPSWMPYCSFSRPDADGGYAGSKLETTLSNVGRWTIQAVEQSDNAEGFELMPRCWVVERMLAWLNRSRRLVKDFKATIESAQAWLIIASVKIMMRKMAASDLAPPKWAGSGGHALRVGR